MLGTTIGVVAVADEGSSGGGWLRLIRGNHVIKGRLVSETRSFRQHGDPAPARSFDKVLVRHPTSGQRRWRNILRTTIDVTILPILPILPIVFSHLCSQDFSNVRARVGKYAPPTLSSQNLSPTLNFDAINRGSLLKSKKRRPSENYQALLNRLSAKKHLVAAISTLIGGYAFAPTKRNREKVN